MKWKCDESVTGIVVTHNTKELIERAFVSIRKFHPTMKIIIVDGSDENDACYKYICSLADKYTRVFHVEENIGHGKGLCLGIEYVDTPFILVFDSDTEMLKSPVQAMLDMVEEDTYGVGYTEKTAFDGYEYGCKASHKGQGWMPYLHPYFCLIQLKEYKKYLPFCHHGAPAVNTMLDIYSKGLSQKVIKEFPGLGHSAGKGWVWKGEPREFIRHDTYGTRGVRVKKKQPEIEGKWDPVITIAGIIPQQVGTDSGGITCITCTGDRHTAMELSTRWMKKQTVQPNQWIIIDDGKSPTPRPDLSYAMCIRREPKPTDPRHTMILNLKEALKYVTGEKIIIWEDDEYYAPEYVRTMSEKLGRYEVVGIARNRYYNVAYRTYFAHANMGHASLAQTAFRKTFLPDLYKVIEGDSFLDIRIWNVVFPGQSCKAIPNITENISKDGRGYLWDDKDNLYVGMKSMPGRKGIGSGHKSMGPKDLRLDALKRWIPDEQDSAVYAEIIQKKSDADLKNILTPIIKQNRPVASSADRGAVVRRTLTNNRLKMKIR